MTTHPDVDARISAWLIAEAPARVPDEVLEDARSRVAITKQRRDWSSAWRFDTMSITKLAAGAAAALVLAIAGTIFFLQNDVPDDVATPPTAPATATPSPTPEATAPGATAAALLPGEFTACVPPNSQFKAGTYVTEVIPGPSGDVSVERTRGFTWRGTITATDPRLSGTHYTSWDANGYTPGSANPHALTEGQASWAEGHRIENDEGAWSGSSVGLTLPDGTQAGGLVVLTGEGAYDGLSAMMFHIDGGCFFDFRGVVTEVPDPPVPYTGG